MLTFDMSKFTGRGSDLPKAPLRDRIEPSRPPLPRDSAPLWIKPREAMMDEYSRIAKETGFAHSFIDGDLAIERLKDFMRAKDWPVFSLDAVCKYMDKKALEESEYKHGWCWRPLRAKDHIPNAKFGRPGHDSGGGNRSPATDFYQGAESNSLERRSRGWDDENGKASSSPYDKLVPIHALRKVAAVEKEHGKPVHFFVSDYATAAHIVAPDPFLMAVIPNGKLMQGVGRFVIDFWDEPGFGLSEQLK